MIFLYNNNITLLYSILFISYHIILLFCFNKINNDNKKKRAKQKEIKENHYTNTYFKIPISCCITFQKISLFKKKVCREKFFSYKKIKKKKDSGEGLERA